MDKNNQPITDPPLTVSDFGKDLAINRPDGSKELRTGGSRAWRNNNPGNLRSGKFSTQYGAIGSAGGFAVFPNEFLGENASITLLRTSNYAKLTIDQAIAKRSPSNENNTSRLQSEIQRIGRFSGSEVIGDLDDEAMARLMNAIKRTEGWQVGKTTIQRP